MESARVEGSPVEGLEGLRHVLDMSTEGYTGYT